MKVLNGINIGRVTFTGIDYDNDMPLISLKILFDSEERKENCTSEEYFPCQDRNMLLRNLL